MKLAPLTETLAVNEDHRWLASKHGTDATGTIVLDGAALGAVYTDGLAKSGTILAKNTSTGRYVPYDQATSANGLNVPAGILFTSIDIRNGTGGFVNSPAALLRHGQVITAKLPRTSSQTGGPHADAVTAFGGRIIFRSE
jgi:Bacteriophage lambda head decoration protein D